MFAGLLGRGKKQDLQRADDLRRDGLRLAAESSLTEAEAALRQAAELRTARLGADAPLALQVRAEFAAVLRAVGRYDEAVVELRDLLVQCPAVLGEEHSITCEVQIGLAALFLTQGSPDEAMGLVLAVLGRRAAPDKLALKAWDVKLRVLAAQGRYREAADDAQELRAQSAWAYGENENWTVKAGSDRVQNLVYLGEYESAERECRELIERHGKEDMLWQAVMNALVLALNGLGDHEKAEATARTALEKQPHVTLALGLARSLYGLGRYEEALQAATDAQAEFQREAERRVAFAAPVVTVTAQALLGLGRLDEAETEARQAVELAEAHLTPVHHSALEAATTLGSVLAAQGRTAEAADQLTRCARAWREHYGPDHPRTRAAEAELAALVGDEPLGQES
jgi:tetratricopeptide (TPR) repeat protein